jgi:hypothetical protein
VQLAMELILSTLLIAILMIFPLAIKIKDHSVTLQDLKIGAILILLKKMYAALVIKERLV